MTEQLEQLVWETGRGGGRQRKRRSLENVNTMWICSNKEWKTASENAANANQLIRLKFTSAEGELNEM